MRPFFDFWKNPEFLGEYRTQGDTRGFIEMGPVKMVPDAKVDDFGKKEC